jgi:anti-sigma factor RsiW
MKEPRVAGSIGPEHDAFAELLAGYVDDELKAEDRARLEQHLAGCGSCRRGLQAQQVIRARLMKETAAAASSTLAERVQQQISQLNESQSSEPKGKGRMLAWAGWLVAAGIGLTWISINLLSGNAGQGSGAPVPPKLIAIETAPIAISAEVMTQFERMDQSLLPRELNLAELSSEVPFHVPALKSPHMRFIAAWTTELFGETAAAIAYRCHDRLVIQYVVSEQQFFRHPEMREAIVRQGVYAVSRGELSAVAWPDRESGSFLVGEFSPSELVAMRL